MAEVINSQVHIYTARLHMLLCQSTFFVNFVNFHFFVISFKLVCKTSFYRISCIWSIKYWTNDLLYFRLSTLPQDNRVGFITWNMYLYSFRKVKIPVFSLGLYRTTGLHCIIFSLVLSVLQWCLLFASGAKIFSKKTLIGNVLYDLIKFSVPSYSHSGADNCAILKHCNLVDGNLSPI